MAQTGYLEVNYNICTGCRLCEIACSHTKEGVINPEASRIKVYQFWPGPIDIPAICRLCSMYCSMPAKGKSPFPKRGNWCC